MANHVVLRWYRLCLGLGTTLVLTDCGGAEKDELARVSTSASALTAGTLPGGTTIEIGITDPRDGAIVTTSSISVSGVARIGVAPPVPTDMALIMDMSGSTVSTGVGCGGDQNADGRANEVLDCEIAALRALNEQAVRAGSVTRIGIGVFGKDGAVADMSPEAGTQLLTPPGADLDAANGLDVGQVLSSATEPNTSTAQLSKFTLQRIDPTSTSFGAGLTQASRILGASTASRKFVIFVSDGLNNYGPSVASVLPSLPAGTIAHTIAAGPQSACSNPDNSGLDVSRVGFGRRWIPRSGR